jgi:hypothetical protein
MNRLTVRFESELPVFTEHWSVFSNPPIDSKIPSVNDF